MELQGTTSEALRRDCMARYFLPLATEVFARAPEAQSVIFAVAQYWDDEADDAAHAHIVICSTKDPQWPSCLTAEGNAFIEDNEAGVYGARHSELEAAARAAAYERSGWSSPWLDDNGQMITAFASYCLEGSSQEDDLDAAYVPYAIARRNDDGAVIEIVGKMLRPEWEDRFDVGYRAPEGP